ncbi:MAG TPA: MFS transporter [Dehalococcoidia bacterium]|nr:MFS transporter [Dehalococcoidia bacterium]
MESSPAKTPSSRKPKPFYGYWIVLTAFLCLAIFSGTGVGAFSLFVTPLQSDFGWGRGEIMLAFTIFFLLTGLAAPPAGGLVDRYGVRGVIAAGALIAGLGFASLSLMQSLWHFYIAFFFIGAGMAAFGQVPASAMVSNWFVKHRGMAIGIMSTGIGAGILVLAPFIGSFLIPTFGWRVAYFALAILVWTLIPLAVFVVRTKPADMGLYPEGIAGPEDMAKAQASLATAHGLNLKMALSTSAFWLLAITFFISGFSSLGVIQNQVPHLQDIGYPLAIAAGALTGLGLGSTIGKFIFGWLCDRIQAKYACAISLVLLAVSTLILMSMGPTSPMAIMWLYAIILGLGAGGWLPTMSMLVNVNFGLISYGAIFGMISLAQGIGGALGPLVGGYMYDTMSTYQWAFALFLALYAIAIPAILLVRRPRL